MYSTSPTTATPEQEVRHFADDRLAFDPNNRSLSLDDSVIGITPTQLKIVDVLTLEVGRFVSPDSVYGHLYGHPSHDQGRLLQSHVYQLRRRLPSDLHNPETGAFRSRYIIGYCAVKSLADNPKAILDGAQTVKLAGDKVVFIPDSSQLVVDGEIKQITPQETTLLTMLASNPNTTVSREHIQKTLSTQDYAASASAEQVWTTVSSLRRIMGPEHGSPSDGIIVNVRGKGYRVKINEE
jgi:DNA-binding response OmpR family regulator